MKMKIFAQILGFVILRITVQILSINNYMIGEIIVGILDGEVNDNILLFFTQNQDILRGSIISFVIEDIVLAGQLKSYPKSTPGELQSLYNEINNLKDSTGTKLLTFSALLFVRLLGRIGGLYIKPLEIGMCTLLVNLISDAKAKLHLYAKIVKT